ncbi:MAG: hypothetical protein GFH27_549279n503 [Chloroflexi bacterium AL-W]|nr:hypothetical protein [Chloroflexi bacterium AL-N1]NOK65468.1 hypothetical protein [Chloroflexi bacterium AL-N10]NOK72266.1 hypothetical protein [Chloroflexi bacterium AL-N5]NOK79648.1 hypothetical protein [Chloroflexi bacterium AL-W]NOK87563.1 hypothetical protein [Chloroflexi bacterium AL-N15]
MVPMEYSVMNFYSYSFFYKQPTCHTDHLEWLNGCYQTGKYAVLGDSDSISYIDCIRWDWKASSGILGCY